MPKASVAERRSGLMTFWEKYGGTVSSSPSMRLRVARDAFVIFDYETFPTRNVLDTMGVTVHSLATWQDILVTARESAQFQTRELAELETFLADPVQWSHAHGGKSSIKTETKGLL